MALFKEVYTSPSFFYISGNIAGLLSRKPLTDIRAYVVYNQAVKFNKLDQFKDNFP